MDKLSKKMANFGDFCSILGKIRIDFVYSIQSLGDYLACNQSDEYKPSQKWRDAWRDLFQNQSKISF